MSFILLQSPPTPELSHSTSKSPFTAEGNSNISWVSFVALVISPSRIVKIFLRPPERYCCKSVSVAVANVAVDPDGQTPADLTTSTCLVASPKNILFGSEDVLAVSVLIIWVAGITLLSKTANSVVFKLLIE